MTPPAFAGTPAGCATRRGLLYAALILLGWTITLIGLPGSRISLQPLPLIMGTVLIRTLLQTGLFIVGHDAMHGLLLPASPRWNQRLGALALMLYGCLPYQACRRNHHRHHRFTASPADPDFHPDPDAGLLLWYGRFMAGYLTLPQMLRLLGAWSLLLGVLCGRSGSAALPVAAADLLLLCIVPLLLSSLQLFVFGTFLPHRRQRQRPQGPGPASLAVPPWLSLLLCYHFCYHREHHENPDLAWHQLPALRRSGNGLAPA